MALCNLKRHFDSKDIGSHQRGKYYLESLYLLDFWELNCDPTKVLPQHSGQDCEASYIFFFLI